MRSATSGTMSATITAVDAPEAPPPSRQASTSVWRQLGLMMNWQLRRLAEVLPLLVLVQIMLAVATVAGYGMLVGDTDRVAGLHLATGAPTITLITVGLVLTPQMIGTAKAEGSLDWMRTLPVPREVFLIADLAVWTLIALPGVAIGVLAGSIRFDVSLRPAWWLAPVALLVSMTAAAVGYALASLMRPTLAQLVSQVLVFVVLLFTPISFPAERMPDWALSLHQWAPLRPMADLMRAGLAPSDFSATPRSWAVLGVWCAASVAAAGWSMRRRG